MIAHRCKNLEKKKKNVACGENQEICGRVLADLLEKARYTTMGKTFITVRGIYDERQGQGDKKFGRCPRKSMW